MSKKKYYFDEKKANRAVAFIEKFLTHTKGELGGQPFILEPFQKDEIIKPIFGWVDKNGLRKYRTVYIEIPRKNGKSNLASCIALYCLFADGEIGAEVISAAADRNQANIVFNIAKQMVINNKQLSKRSKVFRNAITLENNGSYYKSISSESTTAHGMNISCCIFDELHAQKNRDLWDVCTTSVGARRQPLVVAITTAGFDKQSICWEISEYATKVRDGIIKDETFLPILYRAEIEDDWKDPEIWKKANAGFGTIIKESYFEQQFNKALNTPSFVNTFRRLHLNQWTGNETAWLTDDEWEKCNISKIDLEKLKGRECFGGIDLASTRDISALVLIFPDDDGNFDVVPFLFVPESKVDQRIGGDGVDYLTWSQQGYIIKTEGNVQDYKFIQAKFLELADQFNIVSCSFDRWNSSQLIINLIDEGAKMNPIGMGFVSQSAPTKYLETLVLDRKINHGGHPVMRWFISNVVLQEDPAGNIKINKGKSKDKIDGVAALIMALAEYMNTLGGDSNSIYESRGLTFI
tara:strand:- start:918 stop:2480 length:1563 start_codon:yes stop_codon:yes gene_type:complete